MGFNTTTDRLLDKLTKKIAALDLSVGTVTVNTEQLENLLSDGSNSKAIASGTFPVGRAIAGVDAENAAVSANPALVGGRYDSSNRTLGNGDAGAIALNVRGEVIIDNAAMLTDLAAMEVLLTAANVDHAANEALLITIDADTNAIKTNTAAIEVSADALIAANHTDLVAIDAVLDTIKIDTEAIETATEAIQTDAAAIEVLLTAANVDHAANEVLLTGIDADTNAMKVDLAAIEILLTAIDADTNTIQTNTGTSDAFLDTINDNTSETSANTNAIKIDIAALEVLSTAANVDLAALEVLSTAANADLAAVEVLLTAANVDHAANEVLLTGIAGVVKAEDAAHSNGDKGIMSLAVRNDALATLGGADGDYAPLQVDATGALFTNNQFGTFGSILVTGTTATTCGVADRVFVAIYMLTATVFNASSGLVAETTQLYLDDTGTSTDIDGDGGAAIDSITFPAGMTLYGRYTGFTLASGSVVAYVG